MVVRKDEKTDAIYVEIEPAKRRNPNKRLPSYIDLSGSIFDTHFCKVCTELNVQALFLLGILRRNDTTSAQLSALADNESMRISTPGFNSGYCRHHSPSEQHRTNEYASHLKRRELYGCMRRLLSSARVARGLQGGPTTIIRTASFILADRCPDPTLIEMVPNLILNRQGRDPESHDLGLIHHMDAIFKAFEAGSSRFTEFCSAVCFGDRYEIQRSAFDCGLHTNERELTNSLDLQPSTLLSRIERSARYRPVFGESEEPPIRDAAIS